MGSLSERVVSEEEIMRLVNPLMKGGREGDVGWDGKRVLVKN